MRAHTGLALIAVVLTAGLRFSGGGSDGYPLVSIPQGVSAYTFAGKRVFIQREGTLTVKAFPDRAPNGEAIVWCPREQVFVSPAQGDLFTARGEWVDGPSPRDMDGFPVRIDENQVFHVTTSWINKAKRRAGAEISGEVGEFYRRWRSDPSRRIGFCLNPVR